MTDQEQIEQLKAQVNCLRHCLQQARNDKDREAFERCYGRTLASTSEQCLAEVKAKAIEEAIKQCCFESIGGEICYAYALKSIANTFRNQVK